LIAGLSVGSVSSCLKNAFFVTFARFVVISAGREIRRHLRPEIPILSHLPLAPVVSMRGFCTTGELGFLGGLIPTSMPHPTKTPPRGPESAGSPRRGGALAVADAGDAPAVGSRWFHISKWRWLVAAVIVLLVVEGAIVYWLRTRAAPIVESLPKEIPLGAFEFTRSKGRESRVLRGQFDLFVRLTDDLTTTQQGQFIQHQPQLQKAVEEALLRLRAADFSDLRLARLKNRVQEQLNDELGFDGVAEVLISNFKIQAIAATIPPDAPREPDSTEPFSPSASR
jgi:flagellar basal body-associated protein FliL